MQNFVHPGESVRVTASATRAAGFGMLVGRLYGYLVEDAVSGERCELLVEGVVDAPMVPSVSTAEGDLAYMEPSSGLVTKFAGGSRVLVGVFLKATTTSDLTAPVRLNTFFSPA